MESGWHDLLLKGHIVAGGSPEDAVTYIVPFDDMGFGILSQPGGAGKAQVPRPHPRLWGQDALAVCRL